MSYQLKQRIYTELRGRIGNNLFQMAAAMSLGRRMGADVIGIISSGYIVPSSECNKLSDYLVPFKGTILRNCHLSERMPIKYQRYTEPFFNYSALPQINRILLSGYFQSEKYFDESLVRQTYAIPDEISKKLRKRYGNLLALKPASINVRRGDFLNVQDFHPVCKLDYFLAGIEFLGKKRHYIVTSDDPDWCKQYFRAGNLHVVDDVTPVENLYLQSLCYDHIISNSTFSWWGAWLDDKKEKAVIAPCMWFGPKLSHLDTKDLLPSSWIKL